MTTLPRSRGRATGVVLATVAAASFVTAAQQPAAAPPHGTLTPELEALAKAPDVN